LERLLSPSSSSKGDLMKSQIRPFSQRTRPRRWAALTAAALLSACTLGPNFKRPEAPTTKSYTSENKTTLNGGDPKIDEQHILLGKPLARDWWAPFQSPQLDKVIRQAVAGNHNLAATKATLAQ